ncbi:MAG: hypothetical protein DRP63_03890 [Planctomycetota bacterium]|nr:MAG: hypothetical protein DRP63_03890 [Planctomycetota bacterium]
MRKRFWRAQIILHAERFNPSITTKEWLEKRLGIPKVTRFINAVSIAVCETKELVFEATPYQVKLTGRDGELVLEYARRLLKALPETPYTGVTVLFSYKLRGERRRKKWFEKLAPFAEEVISQHPTDVSLRWRLLDGEIESVVEVSTVAEKKMLFVTVRSHTDANKEQILRALAIVYEKNRMLQKDLEEAGL